MEEKYPHPICANCWYFAGNVCKKSNMQTDKYFYCSDYVRQMSFSDYCAEREMRPLEVR